MKSPQDIINITFSAVKSAGGYASFDGYQGTALTIDFGLQNPITDTNCVAQIDIDVDNRYHRPTFNVTTYNETFFLSGNMRKRRQALQRLAVKCSNRLSKCYDHSTKFRKHYEDIMDSFVE